MSIHTEDLIKWLDGQLNKTEKALRAREQMEGTLRSGTDESWAAARLHPDTAKLPPLKQAERLSAAESNKRICVKLRRDVEMFRELIERTK